VRKGESVCKHVWLKKCEGERREESENVCVCVWRERERVRETE